MRENGMVYYGKVRNGAIDLEAGIELPEGGRVRVEVDTPSWISEPAELDPENDPLRRMADFAMTGLPPDLATNIDHYLYGHPKVSE
jgi:hypothetical protein